MNAPSGAGAPLNRGMITISIMLATIMQVVDMTIVNVALPHMQGNMSATQDQISWVLTSYIVSAAIMTPLTGVLAMRLGRKRLFIGAVIGFTIASMLCGMATSLTEIVLFRILQGAFGAPLVPLSQAVILDINPREKHGSAMALWGVGVMVGPILGPTIGGYLTEYESWRWAFYINVPVGILALLGMLRIGVVVLGRQAQAALEGEADLHLGVLEVRLGAEREHLLVALAEALVEIVGHVLAVLQRGDGIELGLDRVEAGLLDGRLVHARGVQVADLLLDRAGLRAGCILCGRLHDVMLGIEAVLAQLVEGAPAGAVGRDRVGGDPLGVDEFVEIRAGLVHRTQLADVEHRRGHRGGAGGGRRAAAGGRGLFGFVLAARGQRKRQAHRQRQRLQILLGHGIPSVVDRPWASAS